MRIRLLIVGAVLLVSASAAAASGAEAAQEPPPGRYIVVLRDTVHDPAAVADEHARQHDARVDHVYSSALKGYSAEMRPQQAEGVRRDPRVEFVEVDHETRALAQALPTGVDRIQADASSTRAGNGSGTVNVSVAIIDTGVDLTHPDLNALNGKNALNPTSCATSDGVAAQDDNGHGTHVAGTVGARDNGAGVVGVAPGARLYAVKVLTATGDGLVSQVICGVDWVTAHGPGTAENIRVANMSLGASGPDGTCSSAALHKAICASVAKGVTYVVAAGNEGVDFKETIPATYNEVLTVTAMADFDGRQGGLRGGTSCLSNYPLPISDTDDTAADFSNFTLAGSSDVGHTIAGPGVCITSTWPGGTTLTVSGTSMASPHVAGTAALCIGNGKCTGLTPSQIRTKLRKDADAQPASYGFVGSPDHPLKCGRATCYYGHLVHSGGY